METFYLTFGDKYPWCDGWVEVRAVNVDMARKRVIEVFGNQWAWLYEESAFEKEKYPDGKLGKTLE